MRAVGIVRVSQSRGREGDSFASPAEQRQRIAEACERDGLELVAVHEEIDVSGGTPLERRDGLREAVTAVEAGEAEVVVVAYFDRLVRSLRVQGEVVSRVEAAGGRVLAVDVGQISEATAGLWLQGTVLGTMAEYYRRSSAERIGAAQAMAIARGVVPWPTLPPGYERAEDGRLTPAPSAPQVAEAFKMRAQGATIKAVRAFLAERGIDLTMRRVQGLLASRLVLGEIHFGSMVNLHAHEPIVDRDTFAAVQRVKVSRGRRAKSDRLLARLGVLRCGTCDGRLVVGHTKGVYPIYRCSPMSDCPRRVTISAVKVEEVVVEAVRELLADAEGTASADARMREAEASVQRAQADLDAALRAFDGFTEPAARERLVELRDLRDAAQGHLDQLGGSSAGLTIRAGADWDRLSLEAQRRLIQATIRRVQIRPGRGDRITVEPFV